MASEIVNSSEEESTVNNLEPTLANGEQSSDSPRPPDTLIGNPEWRLQRWIESPTSPSNNIGASITKDEEHHIETLKAQENDGLYSIQGRQRGDVLVRLYCQTPECDVKAQVIRWHGKLCLYTQNVHQNHLTTPKRGLKKPALRFVQANHEKPRQQLLQYLKTWNYHNKSWSDSKNIAAIKHAKQSAKKISIDECGAFGNLHDLRRALDAHHHTIDHFLASIGPPVGSTSGTQTGNKYGYALRNIIVLHHDVGTRNNDLDNDWSEIIVTFPSARAALQKASSLWGTGHVQQEADYAKGLWVDNLRQVGMVGISDADRKFHPTVIAIQKSEDIQGSTNMLSKSMEMVIKSSSIPSTCLKDGSMAMRSAGNSLLLIDQDCFAHMIRLPFTRGGGVRGSRGSLARYLLNHKDEHGKMHYFLRDVFDILSFVFALSHITTLHDWVTARDLFMNENQDLPDHVYKQYFPGYPRWGAAAHQPGESRSTQGLEKTWDHLKTAKNCHQQRTNAGDLESILEAISQKEDQREEGYTFTTEPTIPKKEWSILSKYSAVPAMADNKSSAFYSIEDGRALMRKEAIGNAMTTGGYVVYVPNNAFTNEWADEALKSSVGGDPGTGMTMQQIIFQERTAEDRKCISSRPTNVKILFMRILGQHLRNNTPKSLPGEDCHSFLTRRSQRDISVNELLGSMKSSNHNRKRKTTISEGEHERELLRKKWNIDVGAAFTDDVEKRLPKDPNEDDEEQSNARKWIAENEKTKQSSHDICNSSSATSNRRSNRLCGRACGHFKEIVVQKSGTTTCNCEHFMTKGWCHDSMVFALVEFNKMPPLCCREVDGISWDMIRDGWKKRLMSTMFDDPGEEWHANNMYKTYLPETDPLFSYSSIIRSVPVPWLCTSKGETPTLGLKIERRADTMGKIQAKIVEIAPQSSAKVLVGDVILKVNDVLVAEDDGALLSPGTSDHIVTAIRQSPEHQIMEFDVIREYRSSGSSAGSEAAGAKTTGLDDIA